MWLKSCNTFLMPGLVIAWELIPFDGGGGGAEGATAAVPLGLKLGIPFFFFVLMWTIHMSGSYHLSSQAG